MSIVTNPSGEQVHQLSEAEALAYFTAVVREAFGVSVDEFLTDREKFKSSPHYESVCFLIPLVDDSIE